MVVRIIEGDALAVLQCLESESVNCVVTSNSEPIRWGIHAPLIALEGSVLGVQRDHLVYGCIGHSPQLPNADLASIGRMHRPDLLDGENQFSLTMLEDQVGQASREQYDGDGLWDMTPKAATSTVVCGGVFLVRDTEPATDGLERLLSAEDERDPQDESWRDASYLPLPLAFKAALSVNQTGQVGVLRLSEVHSSSVAQVPNNDS